MKQSKTPSRTILTLFALAAFGCSPMVSSQPGVPPIEMTLEQFNQGRPANFYYLADASEGYEAVCEEVLEALNEPYSGEPYAEYNEPYSKYLLRSRLSVSWVDIPDHAGGQRTPYNTRYVRTDINNDGVDEDIFVQIWNLSSTPVHYLVISKSVELQEPINQVTPELWIALRDGGSREVGDRLAERIRKELVSVTRAADVGLPSIVISNRNYFDILDINGAKFILRTEQSTPPRQKDTFLILWSKNDSLQSKCWLRSRYTINN